MPDIKIEFRGEEYTIPESKAFAVGELVEDVVTLPEIMQWLSSPRYHKMARALGVMIRFAGGRATDAEIHRELLTQLQDRQGDKLIAAVFMLTQVLMGDAPQMKGGEAEPEKPAAS